MLIFTRIISLLVSIVFVCAIFYNVISTYVLGNANILLSKSDPFNFQIRIEYLNSFVFEPEIESTELESLQVITGAGIKLEPLNARIFALAGDFKQRTDIEAAQPYYVKALAIKSTDQLALTQRFIYLLEKNELKEAIPLIEIISARWPAIFNQLLPSLPLLLQTQENFDEILRRFNGRYNRFSEIIKYLSTNDDQVDLAYRLVLDAHKKYDLDVHHLKGFVIRSLIKQNRVSDAYLLFYKTLSDEENKNLGYVYNSKFLIEPTSSFFDWIIKPQAGVNMRRIETRSLNNEGSEQLKLGGLEIKFLNAPVAFSNVSQLLYLPKRAYELAINYSVDDISGPSPISVKIFCNNTNTILAEIELSKIKTKEEVKTAEFVVPNEGCELQNIIVSNNNRVESWQNRFSGKIILHEINIKLLSS